MDTMKKLKPGDVIEADWRIENDKDGRNREGLDHGAEGVGMS